MSFDNIGMGLINRNEMDLKNGLNLKNLYMTFMPLATMSPQPIGFNWGVDGSGNKQYFATATVYVYASETAKLSGKEPIETTNVSIPVDGAAVFGVLYESLKQQYPNYRDVPDADELPDVGVSFSVSNAYPGAAASTSHDLPMSSDA